MEHIMEAFYLSGNIKYNISLQQTHNNNSTSTASATNNPPAAGANTTSKLIIHARSKTMNKWSTTITDNFVLSSTNNISGLCMPVCELFKLLDDSINQRNNCLTVTFPSTHQDKPETLSISVALEIKYIGKKEFNVILAPEEVSDVGRMEMLVEELGNENHVLRNQVNGLQNQVLQLQQQFILLQLEMKMLKVRCFDERSTPFHNPAPLPHKPLNQQIWWADTATASSQPSPRGWGGVAPTKHAHHFSAPTPASSRAPTPVASLLGNSHQQALHHLQPALQPLSSHLQPANLPAHPQPHPQSASNLQAHPQPLPQALPQPANNHPQPVQQTHIIQHTNNNVSVSNPTPWNSWSMVDNVIVDPTPVSQPTTPIKQPTNQQQQQPTSPGGSLWEVTTATTADNTPIPFWDAAVVVESPAAPIPMNPLWDSTDVFSTTQGDVLSSPVTASSSAVPLWDFRRSPSSETAFLHWHDC